MALAEPPKEIRTYHLPPTPSIPNSPLPLLHYPRFFTHRLSSHRPTPSLSPSASPLSPSLSSPKTRDSETHDPLPIHALLKSNRWTTQWIWRYGPTQQSHYHSAAHECMTVLSGTARIRFGLGDDDISEGDGEREEGERGEAGKGVEIEANPGDVFILPAGTAHKTFRTQPEMEMELLTPGEGHGVLREGAGERREGDDERRVEEVLREVRGRLKGFTMMGAYPEGSQWDFRVGGEDCGEGGFERVWGVEKPERDPVLGEDERGLRGSWN